MNKAFLKPGPPKTKLGYGPISDLKRGVPVSVVAKRNGLSRGTVYRIIKDNPELAKEWEEKRKKKQPDPAPALVPDPAPVRPTTPPLPDVLLQFLAAHKPTIASSSFPVKIKRTALRNVLSQLGLVQEDEFDALTDEELVIRVTAYQGKGGNHPDEDRWGRFQVETDRG